MYCWYFKFKYTYFPVNTYWTLFLPGAVLAGLLIVLHPAPLPSPPHPPQSIICKINSGHPLLRLLWRGEGPLTCSHRPVVRAVCSPPLCLDYFHGGGWLSCVTDKSAVGWWQQGQTARRIERRNLENIGTEKKEIVILEEKYFPPKLLRHGTRLLHW